MAAAPSPIIDENDSRRRRRKLAGGRSRHAQQRIGVEGHREPRCKRCSGFTAQGERDVPLRTAEPFSPASGKDSHMLQALWESPAGKGGIAAPEPPSSQLDRRRPTLPGQIAQFSHIAAVDGPASMVT